ncbi:MAG: hypothetical protein Q9191_004510 [Dirinaria sp. TL-2023a]
MEGSSRSASTVPPKDRLSCKLCQRRKVGCDKGDPCSTCKRAGVKCEVAVRQRLPRGRNGGRKRADAELKQRIGRLEALVTSLTSASPTNEAPPTKVEPPVQAMIQQQAPDPRSLPPEYMDVGRDMTRYLGSSYWSHICEEVNGLRDVLDASSDSETETPESDQTPEATAPSKPSSFNFVLCGPDSFMMAPDALQRPTPAIVEKLLATYFTNVDPIFKIVHAPSVRAHLQENRTYLGHAPGDPAVTALSFAIYYATIATLSQDHCQSELGESKVALRNRFRFGVEASLAQADFINSGKVACLQAFLLLLVATRTDDNSRWTWTLISLAVRIAHALGLQKESVLSSMSVFEAEMRRRVWHCICMLDSHSSNDRGSDTLIKPPEYNTWLPSNINDSDISPDSTVHPAERVGITDMSPNLIISSSMKLFWQLSYVPLGDWERPPLEMQYDWGKRQAVVEQQIEFIQDKFVRHCNPEILLQRFMQGVTTAIFPLLRLIALRPIQRHPAAKPPRVDSAVILRLCISLFEGTQDFHLNPAIKQWGWFFWVQWHPLAVALAELCSCTEGPLVEATWQVVDVSFQQFAELVADTTRGLLFRPIDKLYRKARANKAARDASKAMEKPQQQRLAYRSGQLSDPPTNRAASVKAEYQAPPQLQQQQQQPSPSGTMSGLGSATDTLNQELGLGDEPNDMAWLDWATFTEDVTDLNMLDPINLMDPAWST